MRMSRNLVIVISAGIFMWSSILCSSLDFRGFLFTRASIMMASMCKIYFRSPICNAVIFENGTCFFSSFDVSRLCELNRRYSIHFCFDTNHEEADYIQISKFFIHLVLFLLVFDRIALGSVSFF